jgi:hypothetical protein
MIGASMYYDLTNVQFVKMLKNLSVFFDKSYLHAEVKKFDVNVLLKARLAPDQFDFTRQIQILCDTAKKCAAQLVGREAPVHADNEMTLDELRARVTNVIAYLEGIPAKDYAEAANRRISQPRWEGQYLTGHEFVIQHAIPNFYFHLTTAYSILRHNGIDLGKKDYLGKMPFHK